MSKTYIASSIALIVIGLTVTITTLFVGPMLEPMVFGTLAALTGVLMLIVGALRVKKNKK